MTKYTREMALALLQAEQYDSARYLAKLKRINPLIRARLRLSVRMRATQILSYALGIVGANEVIGWVVAVYTRIVWRRVQAEIARHKARGMRVVAIAGSYGKTSVKHYAYELLRHKYFVVATPESYNTVLGIAKCLKWEVDTETQIFLVEVGAYKRGDITHLLEMVQPDLGVLTGMARQHLERFGSWEAIQAAKGEIASYMNKVQGKLVANGSDQAVVANVEKMGVAATWYRGSGRREINMAGAQAIAKACGMSVREIQSARVRDPRSRFEMTTTRYGMAVIDDSYSSNDIGFREAIHYLATQDKYTRILVTPGLVELGRESNKIHEELGKQVVGNADYVMLVGHNERTKCLEQGIGGKVKVIYIEKTLDFMQAVKDLKLKKEPLVLLENDVTENY